MRAPGVRRRAVVAGLAGIGLGLPASARAADWPERAIRIIVPYPPGAANDTMARVVADGLSPRLGRSVVVENRPGATGAVGTEVAVRAEPDGYTLVLVNPTTVAVNPVVFPKLRYSPERDLAGVALIAETANVVVVGRNSPFRDIRALVAAAKASPRSVRYSASGFDAVILAFALGAGVVMEDVQYRGMAPALNDLVGGQVDMSIASVTTVMPLVSQGLLRALAVTTPARVEGMEDVPTLAETVAPGFDVRPWYGIAAPSRTPPEILARLNAEILAVLEMPAVLERMRRDNSVARRLSVAGFDQFLREEASRWDALIRPTGIRME